MHKALACKKRPPEAPAGFDFGRDPGALVRPREPLRLCGLTPPAEIGEAGKNRRSASPRSRAPEPRPPPAPAPAARRRVLEIEQRIALIEVEMGAVRIGEIADDVDDVGH